MKTCARCYITKPYSEFSKGPRYRDGYQSYCKDCMRAYRAEKFSTSEAIRAERDRTRDYYRNNQEARERNRAAGRERDKEKWHNDPNYRDRKNKQKRELIRKSPRWQRNARMYGRIKQQRRRARLHLLTEHFTKQQWEELCAKYDHRCLACGAKAPLTADHIVPLSRGGSNAIGNIQPLCKPCNNKKYTRTIDMRPIKQSLMEWDDE